MIEIIHTQAVIENELTLLIGALTALSGIITLFWKIIHANHREAKSHGDRLEVKLEEQNVSLLKLTNEMGELRGRVSLAEEIAPKIEALATILSQR